MSLSDGLALANIVLVVVSIFAALQIALWQLKKHNEEKTADEKAMDEKRSVEEYKSQLSVILFDLYSLNHLYATMLGLSSPELQGQYQHDHDAEFQNNNISVINNLVRATRLSKEDCKFLYEAIASAKFVKYEERIEVIQEAISRIEPIVNPNIAEVFREVSLQNQRILEERRSKQ